MTVLIVSSTTDPASVNIKKKLFKYANWDEKEKFNGNPVYRHTNMKDIVLITINDSKIRHEHLDTEVEKKLGIIPKQVIFISRHRSKTGSPTLTVHPIGNFRDAHFGGQERTLVKSSPRLMTHYLKVLKKNTENKHLSHLVSYEVTHHGPYLDTPSLFIEVGSTETEWRKQKPAAIVAKSLLEVLQQYHYEEDFSDDIPILLGIGGGHYAPRFTDVVFKNKAAFGHMIPTYQMESGTIDTEIILKALQATPNANGVYIHRKALKKSLVSALKDWCQHQGIPIISSRELPVYE